MPGDPLIQAPAPGRVVRPKRTYRLPLAQVHPQIRLAHRSRGGLAIAPRIIFDHELVWLIQGSGLFRCEGQETRLSAGDLLFIRPFDRHRFDIPDPCAHAAVHFDLSAHAPDVKLGDREKATYAVQLSDAPPLPSRVELRRDDPICAWLDSIVERFAQDEPLAKAEASATLGQVLLAMLRRAGPQRDARFEKLAAFVNANLHKPIDAPAMAQATGLSQSQLRRLLRARLGLSPMDYLRRCRVDRARKLLTAQDAAIKEVAYRCGFSDPFHFSRAFRREDGLSPSQFRRAARPDAR